MATIVEIKLKLNVAPIILDVGTAIPVGLVLNELLTNALKYAFPEERKGEIQVSIDESEKGLQLLVSDNGKGIEQHLEKVENGSKGFGYRMIHSFAQKLDAVINVKSESGTKVEMLIKNYKIA